MFFLLFVSILVSESTKVNAASTTLFLGSFNSSTNSFSKVAINGDETYKSLIIMFTKQTTMKINQLPDTSGFVKDQTNSTNYSTVINMPQGKSASEVQEYLRRITFSDAEAGATVRVILSKENSLNNKVLYFNGNQHYYIFVKFNNNDYKSWTDSYNLAKNMTYMGRKGYLATITSLEEDLFVKEATNGEVGWLGGTRLNPGTQNGQYYESFDITAENSRNYWYWACGPEIGKEFFDISKVTSQQDYQRNKDKGYYFNWNNNDYEPNNNGSENALTTLSIGNGYSTLTRGYSWNDIKYQNLKYNGTYTAMGYLVEFGDQPIGDSGTGENKNQYTSETIVILGKNLTYNANDQELITSVSTNDGILYYSLDGVNYSTNIPVARDAGTYTVYYKVIGDENHNNAEPVSLDVTIKKAESTMTTVPLGKNLTYNANDQELIISGSTNDGILYYSLDGVNYSTDVPVARDAGTYTVYYKVIGDENHNNIESVSLDVTIYKAKFNVPHGGQGYIINYKNETLIATNGYELSTSNESLTPMNNNKLIPGNTYYLRKAEDNNHHPSDWAQITINTRPTQPNSSNLLLSSPTYINSSDGKISGVDDSMEYSIDNGKTWTSINGIQITNLPSGNVLIRYQATDSNFASQSVEVTVNSPIVEFNKYKNDKKNTINSMIKDTDSNNSLQNQKAADNVISKINQIGKVQYDDNFKSKIDHYKSLYNNLTDEQKSLVPTNILSILTNAEQDYNDLINRQKEWGTKHVIVAANSSKYTYWVDSKGTSSTIVGDDDVTWLYEESYDSNLGKITSAWYGLGNPLKDDGTRVFKEGSRFWVRWINQESDPDDWAIYYNMLDDEHKRLAEENKLWIFLTGVTGPDGTQYKVFDLSIPYYVQLGEDWDKDEIHAIFIDKKLDEIIDVSYISSDEISGCPYNGEFAKLTLEHFSPYALFDEIDEISNIGKNAQEHLTSLSGNHKNTGDYQIIMFMFIPIYFTIIYFIRNRQK